MEHADCVIYTPGPRKAAAEQGAPNNGTTPKTRLMWVEVPGRGLKPVRREVSPPAARASPQKGRPTAGPVGHSTGCGRAANVPTLGPDGKLSRRRGQTAQVSQTGGRGVMPRKKKAGAQAKKQGKKAKFNLTIRAQDRYSEQVHPFKATPDTKLNRLFMFAMGLTQYIGGFLFTVYRTGAQYTREDGNQSLGELGIKDGDEVQICAIRPIISENSNTRMCSIRAAGPCLSARMCIE